MWSFRGEYSKGNQSEAASTGPQDWEASAPTDLQVRACVGGLSIPHRVGRSVVLPCAHLHTQPRPPHHRAARCVCCRGAPARACWRP